MTNYYLLFLLYAPILLLCFLSLLRDKYEFESIALEAKPFPLMISTVFIAIILSISLIKSTWVTYPVFGYKYSDAGGEWLFLISYTMILIIAIVVLKIVHISIFDILNIQNSFVYNMVIISSIATFVVVLLPQLLGVDLTPEFKTDDLSIIRSYSPTVLIIFIFNTTILTPIVEETIFRGLLYPPLYRKIGRNASLLLASYIFLHSHFGVFYQGILVSFVTLFRGFFFVWLYEKKKTLVYPIGFHMLFNAWTVYLHIL